MLTVNIDIQIRFINGQMGTEKCSEIVNTAASTAFIKCSDPKTSRQLIGANRLVSQNKWVLVKRNEIHIFGGNSSKQGCFN